jgi:glycerol-3-phosphate dehydrogenase (NAD(P)+)
VRRRVAVLGAGSWGSAFAAVLADAGHDVVVWARREELAARITATHRNPDYLPDTDLGQAVTGTASWDDALDGAETVVLAVPAQSLRANLADRSPLPPVPVLSLLKGIENGTAARMSQVVAEAGRVAPERIAVLSGPNLAREIAARQPAASVVACPDPDLAARLTHLVQTPVFRPYASTDVVGVEIAGALKNVIALAAGIASGMGLGDNTKATIITRGLAEITRLGLALGAEAATFSGLAGVGDLVATCASTLSRNQRVGIALGRGLDLAAARAEVGQTAEGVTTAGPVLELARGVGQDMPITEAVDAVLRGGSTVQEATAALLSRPLRTEGPGSRVLRPGSTSEAPPPA